MLFPPVRWLLIAAFLAVGGAGLVGAAGTAAVDPPSGVVKSLGEADAAWDRGDYISALTEYLKVLDGAADDAAIDGIALKTGELQQSYELTADGRNPKFSPDGRYISYETGLEVSRRTKVIRNDATRAIVADLPGVGLAFAPAPAAGATAASSNRESAAYLKITETPEMAAASRAVEAATLTASNRGVLVQALAWHVLTNTTITYIALETKAERQVPTAGLFKTALAFDPLDGLVFLGRRETDESRNDIYRLRKPSAAAGVEEPEAMVIAGPDFRGVPIVDPSGRYLLYTLGVADPLRRPAAIPAPPGVTVAAAPAPGAAAPPQASFAVRDLVGSGYRVRTGTAPAFSADGRLLAYVDRPANESRIQVGEVLGESRPVKTIANAAGRVDAPALSADGSRLAFQMMTRDDWELFTADIDGTNETRLTRDMQHDLLPQFVSGGRLLQVIGEPRHRRSFLIDMATGTQTRLFHNNLVRTIAPEYQWIVSKRGDQVLIVAERDGNTVSPERGVYLVDLNRKVAKSDLIRRLEASLASERTLRDAQTKAFAPIERQVRDAVAEASVSRVYSYEKALFDFDSKHISRPGNRRAAEYLFNAYKSFGYEPEYQWFDNRQAADGRTANVIARLPGTVNPELIYVVSSHFDSVAGGPGADDDSSGTAALLEAARVLASRPQPATIIFASFTGEESGLLGSAEFVRRAVASGIRVVGALNNDMIGWANDFHLDNTIRYSNPGIRDIQHGAAMLFTRLITYDALYYKGTDAVSYYDAFGDIVGGIGSYPVLSSPHYHQSHDLLEYENHDQITETSKTTIATLMRLASSPSRISGLRVTNYETTARAAGGTATIAWDASPEKGVASYLVSVTAPGAASARITTVNSPRATLQNVAAGSTIAVKAVNSRGLEGWDWAQVGIK